MQDRPTASELLEAAVDFLDNDIAPELTGRKRFHLRVLVNVLKIVSREVDGEHDAIRSELARLLPFIEADETQPTREGVRQANVDLAARIRSGDLDDRWDEVLGAVYASVVEKLAIANPNYASSED